MPKSSQNLLSALLLLGLIATSGCNSVHRKMVIRSNPEGALVTVDRQPIGHTPVSVPYTYYGTREIQVEKDGFQTQKVKHRFKAPWFQIPPFDFVTENFWPREIRDDRVVDFALAPLPTVDQNYLLDRANQLRGNVQRGTVTMPLAHQQPEDQTVVSEPEQTALLPEHFLPRQH